jgi:hypothetical protein
MVLAVAASGAAGAATREDLVCPVRADWNGEPDQCPCKLGWKPKPKQLRKILADHGRWVEQEGWTDPTIPGLAILCHANLKGAYLGGANIAGGDLGDADLQQADLGHANLQGTDLGRANLQKAALNVAKLREAHLFNANLQEANLWGANLQGAELGLANLQGAMLFRVNLKGADLSDANLRGATLLGADLQEADLWGADLRKADLTDVDIENARLARSNLDGAIYATESPPPSGELEGIEGLAGVSFPSGGQTGLVRIRELLKKAGLRELERQATFAIEHGKARHARQSGSWGRVLGGWLRLIFFEWTTGWGLYPERALLIMLGVLVVMAVVYAVPIATPPAVTSDPHGIFRVWPRERLEPGKTGMTAAEDIRVERLSTGMPASVAFALYFSMLSAFHIGWRDLNVGTWLSRIQPQEYVLRAHGWVRVVSGLQSLISVFLVAMWVLTTFGRPF